MYKLIRYEIRKIISSKFIMGLFAVLFLLNCYISWDSAKLYRDNTKAITNAYRAVLEDYDGVMEYREELKALLRENLHDEDYVGPSTYDPAGVVSDYIALDRALERYTYIQSHTAELDAIITFSEERAVDLESFGFRPQSYTVQQHIRTGERYAALRDTIELESVYSYGYDKYLSQTTVAVLLAVLMTAVTAYVFLNDTYNGFISICRSTEHGRKTLIWAKIGTVILICVSVSVLFLLAAFAAVGIACGYSTPFAAIQTFPEYYAVPYNISIIGYILLNGAMRILGLLGYTLFAAAGAMVTGSYMGAFASGFAFLFVNTALYLKEYLGTAPASKYVNFVSMTMDNEVTRIYRTANFLGIPISYAGAMVGIAVTVSIVCTVSCALLSNRFGLMGRWNLFGRRHRNTGSARLKKSRCMLLPVYELSKARFSLVLLAIVVLLAAKTAYLAVTVPGMESYTKAMYYQYMQKIQELDGEARALYMVDERADIDSIIEQFAVIEKEYEMGKIPYEEYKSYLTTYYDAKERNNVFIRVENYVGYVERKNTQLGLEEKPIYTEGYEAYFADTADLFAGIALIILCVNVFTTEYRSQSSSAGCINIVRSTLRGRWQTFWTKTILFSLLGGVTAVLFRLVDWMVISQKYVFDYKEAALYCLGIFSKITTVISIEEYMVWDMAMRFFGGIILSLMICILSYAGKKILSVLSLTVLITAIPEILVLTVLKSKAELSPLTLLCPHRLLYAYSGNVYSQETAVAVWAAVLGCIALAAAIICGMRFAGKKWRIG